MNAIQCSSQTHAGHLRQRNEDYMITDADSGIFMLADGMGGHRSGDFASKMACESVMHRLHKSLPSLSPDEFDPELGYTRASLLLRQALLEANEKILQEADSNPEHAGMGTTIVVAWFYRDQLTIAHVGDSRLYRLRQGRLEQLTSDHTIRQELIDRGYYDKEQAETLVQRNLVTRALGADRSVAIDIQETMTLPGDLYLLCSDGLYDMVEEQTILHIMNRCYDLTSCVETLTKTALGNGGKDNVSVICIRSTPSTQEASRDGWKKRIKRLLRL